MSYNGKEIAVLKDTLSRFILFTGKYCEGKTYLHWEIECQKEDGIYIVYRSIDDVNYELLGSKQGIGVPVFFPISYYLQDENPPEGTVWYTLVHISKNKIYMVSEKISVVRPNLFSSDIK